MANKRSYKHKTQRIRHVGMSHEIRGKVIKGSLAEYLMLKQKCTRMDDSWMLAKFKNGKQLLFNTKFVQNILDTYKELHCEICGKEELRLFYWWEQSHKVDRKIMATADHFFPKSRNKELLAFEPKNIVIACDNCNNKKSDDIYDISTVKFPYPDTIQNLSTLKVVFDALQDL